MNAAIETLWTAVAETAEARALAAMGSRMDREAAEDALIDTPEYAAVQRAIAAEQRANDEAAFWSAFRCEAAQAVFMWRMADLGFTPGCIILSDARFARDRAIAEIGRVLRPCETSTRAEDAAIFAAALPAEMVATIADTIDASFATLEAFRTQTGPYDRRLSQVNCPLTSGFRSRLMDIRVIWTMHRMYNAAYTADLRRLAGV
jgi:hypothetical protein